MASNVTSISERLKGKNRRLKMSVGQTVQSKRVKNEERTWAQIADKLYHVVRTPETYAEYQKMPLTTQNDVKDVGYFVAGHFTNGIRRKENLTEKCLITIDADHLPEDHDADVEMAWGHLAYVMHTTHKHCVEKPRKRFVFPLTRDVTEVEWLAVCRKVASWLEMNWIDHTTYQFSRVMHFPSCSMDGEFLYHHNEGAWLDPDEVLATYSDWKDVSQWPMSDSETKEIRLSAQKAGNPLEKQGIVGAFCRSYTILEAMHKFIPDAYLDGNEDNRFSYAGGSSANGAVIYDDGLFLYSHHEHDPCSGRSVNAFDMVRLHKFGMLDENIKDGSRVTTHPSYEAMVNMVQTDALVLGELAVERLEMDKEFDDFGTAIEPPAPEIDELDKELGLDEQQDPTKAWTKKLIVVDGQIAVKLTNLELLLDNDPKLSGCIAYNEFTADYVQLKPIPGLAREIPENGRLWDDLAEVNLKGYLERRYRLTFSVAMIHEAVMTLGHRNRFHPLRAKLDTLEWDGVERIDRLFVHHFGAEDTAYTRAITRKWFAAAVARLYCPGIKFDYILVVEGLEGLRKSSFFDMLAYCWFTDNLSFGMEPKEVIETTRNAWVVEIPEMITRGGAESEHVKAFLARRVDRARAAYARNAEDYPRKFVLVGTTNESSYLRSLTGNRRFWCLKGDGRTLDLEAIALDRDQLWAEARDAWTWGEPLWLENPDVLAEAKAQQQARVVKDDLAPFVEAWLDKPISPDHWNLPYGSVDDFATEAELLQRDRTCVLEIWIECLGGDVRTFGKRESTRIGEIMRALPGWEEVTSTPFGVRYKKSRGFRRVIDMSATKSATKPTE